ncbi:hypothetical protein [Laspinema olomoucense]|uniref:Uncharacterized protein n=1 Tax=Laspinema olomoucense D3b TaxID=2953688 RepID=A0ABT2NEH2_9CYAN|nr:hypothetical protein [Laspinema sp. D3b]MCT7981097.1 hypothetical protein [Laspinema sp. D3b]
MALAGRAPRKKRQLRHDVEVAGSLSYVVGFSPVQQFQESLTPVTEIACAATSECGEI